MGLLLLIGQSAALLHSVGHASANTHSDAHPNHLVRQALADEHGHIDFRLVDFSATDTDEPLGCAAYHTYLLHTPAVASLPTLPGCLRITRAEHTSPRTHALPGEPFDAYTIRGPPHADIHA